MTPKFFTSCPRSLSSAPIHKARSGFTGFFTSTGLSVPFKASAISCTVNGFTVERAPIHRISTSACKAAATWCALATSVAVLKPYSSFTFFSQLRPMTPTPSKPLGFVRGFQIPARKIETASVDSLILFAVSSICDSLSALQGPAIIKGEGISCTQLFSSFFKFMIL